MIFTLAFILRNFARSTSSHGAHYSAAPRS